ncbi:hypothetical protein [Entomobacter blattae]|uniref:Uncharacterized protein n=1 Tax=Entomobacter blattae TaxID=2762277 RepID=A0A7H1NR71_9PROT|nr:hypothetical protein [Entomobacter blattae]QNT78281.1 hypothetical protein JGUZn3_10530 [Entomobacter blattae]
MTDPNIPSNTPMNSPTTPAHQHEEQEKKNAGGKGALDGQHTMESPGPSSVKGHWEKSKDHSNPASSKHQNFSDQNQSDQNQHNP